ncbi:hypothetical protein MBLNU459_g2761t2 [Dothideomycetes sp. NU459]
MKLLDMEKVNREEADYQSRNTSAAPALGSVVSTSPSYQYPTGPPPPYSHPAPQLHASTQSALSEIRSPPESRRMSADEQPKPQQQQQQQQQQPPPPPKQSLPSIHEALGVEQPLSYSSQTPFTSAPQPAYQAPTAPASPSIAPRRSFGMEPPPPPGASYSQAPPSPYLQHRRGSSPRQTQDHSERRPIYASQPPATLHPIRTGHSPVQHAARYSHPYPAADPSPTHERGSATVSSMAAPAFPYGYTPYPPQFGAYPPTTGASSTTVYQPSATQPPPAHSEASWKTERHLPGTVHETGRAVYGESVKRHLDLYDFEAALNEVAESSGYVLEFSRQCGARLHQTQRSGPLPGTLPGVSEIDAMMNKQRHALDALSRLREVIVAQEAAFFQQAQEQQFKAQDEGKRNDSFHNSDDTKGGGFAGPEAKKRRGRAAPPGRCHSCNRAETPEWRRGPDGARTLCNACGLHYAKLTRKQSGQNKAAISSSNLRPKNGSDSESR